MALSLDCVTIDARDPGKLASFWAEVLDYTIEYDSADDPDHDLPEREVGLAPTDGSTTKLLFVTVTDEKKTKNPLHFDLRPDDQDAEVARVEKLGATKVDIGQGDQTWVVMADPEGNEFCILRSRAGDN